MVMTHYMELLSLHQPWFLIVFMLVPMVMAETILAADAVSLINNDERSKKWDSIAHGVTILLGVFFIVVAVYLVSSYVPTIEWRGPIDYIAVWSYILAVIPAVLLLLQGLGVIFKGIDKKTWLKRHLALMILFIFFTHMAMVFGMADPQLAGYMPPQESMHMEQSMHMNHDQMNMNHEQMNMK